MTSALQASTAVAVAPAAPEPKASAEKNPAANSTKSADQNKKPATTDAAAEKKKKAGEDDSSSSSSTEEEELKTAEQQDDRFTFKRKRRSRNDNRGRDYKCGCGKMYLSYPALYTHVKTKHAGKTPCGSTGPACINGNGRRGQQRRKDGVLDSIKTGTGDKERENGPELKLPEMRPLQAVAESLSGIVVNNNNNNNNKTPSTTTEGDRRRRRRADTWGTRC